MRNQPQKAHNKGRAFVISKRPPSFVNSMVAFDEHSTKQEEMELFFSAKDTRRDYKYDFKLSLQEHDNPTNEIIKSIDKM